MTITQSRKGKSNCLKTERAEMEETLMTNPESTLVYGEDYASYLYFTGLEEARAHAGLWEAFCNKLTFEVLKEQSPAGFDLLISGLCQYLGIDTTALPDVDTEAGAYFDALFDLFYEASREGKNLAGEGIDEELLNSKDAAREYYENVLTATYRFPLRHEVFCSKAMDPYFVHDLIGNPCHMGWLPVEVLHAFGEVQNSLFDGPITLLHARHEEEIVARLEEYGYTCTRNDRLVNRALAH
jgi:hypothetical protein